MEQLDPSQRLFCEAPSSNNIRLLAPAGCGKTLCLLFRCKHLAEQAKPRRLRFLLVTFTRAAMQELSSRLDEDNRFAHLQDSIEITTLNAWGNRRIRNAVSYPRLLNTERDYHFATQNQLRPVWRNHEPIRNAIQSRNRRTRVIAPRKLMDVIDGFKSLGFDHVRHANFSTFAQHWRQLELQGLQWRLKELLGELIDLDILDSENHQTINRILALQRNGVDVGSLVDDGVIEIEMRNGESGTDAMRRVIESQKREVYDMFYKFWLETTEHLLDSATFTLEDQKYFAYLDERKSIEQGSYLSGAAGFDHVFVDEFQDINPLDLALVKAIVDRRRATLTISGDDDQAIFEWRGATPYYILDPDRFFGSVFHTYTLGVNYRSPNNIVEHSQQLISHNSRREHKQVNAASSRNAQIEIKETDGLIEALEYVDTIVNEEIQQGRSPSRVAIIGRKRSQIIPYQMHFASREMPFCAAEDLQIFLSDTFGSLLHLLDIKSRSEAAQRSGQVIDDLLFLCDRVKRYHIINAEKQTLTNHLQQSRPSSIIAASNSLAEYRGRLKGENREGRMSIAMANSIGAFINALTVSDALSELSVGFEGLQSDFGKAEHDIFYVDPPFLQLAEYASSYGDDYDSFIDDIDRARETLVYIPPYEEEDQENLWNHPLHLMTALRAKGKEFNTVILLDVNDDIWPNRNAETPAQHEAERRVFYVAFTRARKRVVMLLNNRVSNREAVASRYIQELGL